jgi:hypothetical protein
MAITPFAMQLSASTAADQRAADALARFLTRPPVAHEYSASRRLEASGRGQRAWLDVQTDFSLSSGLLYDVTGEGGSGFIRSRVLRSLLDEEQRLVAQGGATRVAMSTVNYQFAAAGVDEEGLAIVSVQPRRKERGLVAGRMFLTADGDLLRLEGRLDRNPSFWVTRVDVVRSYRQINGVFMPASLDTTAQLRFFGASALRMTYRYSHIDGQPVDDPQLE